MSRDLDWGATLLRFWGGESRMERLTGWWLIPGIRIGEITVSLKLGEGPMRVESKVGLWLGCQKYNNFLEILLYRLSIPMSLMRDKLEIIQNKYKWDF